MPPRFAPLLVMVNVIFKVPEVCSEVTTVDVVEPSGLVTEVDPTRPVVLIVTVSELKPLAVVTVTVVVKSKPA